MYLDANWHRMRRIKHTHRRIEKWITFGVRPEETISITLIDGQDSITLHMHLKEAQEISAQLQARIMFMELSREHERNPK